MADLDTLLRNYREAAGLSQEELADRAGLSVRGVSDLERGVRRNPYPATVRRLAAALELGPEDRAILLAVARAPARDRKHDPPPVVEQGTYFGPPPGSGLVGRRTEVLQLEHALESSLAGSGQLLLLTGEAGIGKTRLAQELTDRALARGCIVATGRCYEPQQGVPFYPFLDALAALYYRAPADVQQALPERWPYLERLLPDVFPTSTIATSDGADELQRLLRSAAGFVRACLATRPVVLVVDDLQWADNASLDLLQHLVRHARGTPVAIAATAREPELDSAVGLHRALVDLRREGLLERLRLRRLQRADTAALLADLLGSGQPSAVLIDTIDAASGGNPFFAIELLQTMRARGDLTLANREWACRFADAVVVPETVRASILERYSHLSPLATRTVDAAAVFGQTFLVDDVAAVVGADEETVDLALQEATRSGLIQAPLTVPRERPLTEDFGFVHALTHQAIYEHLAPHQRRRLHLRAAETLAVSGRAAVVARHFQLALQAARALPYLLIAGDQAEAVFAHHEAGEHYRASLAIATELADRDAEARSLLGLGRSWLAAGHPERALEQFEAAIRTYRALDDPEGEADALARVAQVYFARGNWDAGLERIPAAIERLERRQPSRALGLLYACMAMVMPASVGTRLRAAERASAVARSLADDDLLVEAEARRGFVLMLAGRLSEARAVLEAILPLAEARKARDALGIVIGVLGEVAKLQGDIRRYLSLAERGVARAQEAGDSVGVIGALSGVGEAEFLLGHWDRARATYMRVQQEASGVDAAWYHGFVELGLAAIDVAEGNTVAATEHLAHCLTDSPRLGHQNRREHALRLLALEHLMDNQPAAALERLEEVRRVEGDEHAGTQALLAWAHLELEDASVAASVVRRAVELACSQGNRLDLCEALLVRAEVEGRANESTAAARTLADALALAESMPCPYAAARLRYARARLLAEVGPAQAAAEELEAAIAIFSRLGARPYLARAEHLQVRLLQAEDRAPKSHGTDSPPQRY